jgi:hypothetical protein
VSGTNLRRKAFIVFTFAETAGLPNYALRTTL